MSDNSNSCYCFGNPCETVTALTALALSIANGKSADDIDLIGTYFVQLGDTLATIAATKSSCCDE